MRLVLCPQSIIVSTVLHPLLCCTKDTFMAAIKYNISYYCYYFVV